jgi:hypothetical protein
MCCELIAHLRLAEARIVQLKFYLVKNFAAKSREVASRNVWSAAELQAKNEEWQLVCANVFGL